MPMNMPPGPMRPPISPGPMGPAQRSLMPIGGPLASPPPNPQAVSQMMSRQGGGAPGPLKRPLSESLPRIEDPMPYQQQRQRVEQELASAQGRRIPSFETWKQQKWQGKIRTGKGNWEEEDKAAYQKFVRDNKEKLKMLRKEIDQLNAMLPAGMTQRIEGKGIIQLKNS